METKLKISAAIGAALLWLTPFVSAQAASQFDVPADSVADLPNPPQIERLDRPAVEDFGGGLFVTRTQSDEFRGTLSSDQMAEQTKKYGQLYRQLSISSDDGGWLIDPAAGGAGVAKQFSCDRKSKNTVAKFLGAIFGYEKKQVSLLTLTVKAPSTSTGSAERVLIKEYPVIAMHRTGANKCEYQLNTIDLTPYVNVRSSDRVLLSFTVRQEKSTRLDFSTLLGLVSEVATLTSENLTDGVVNGVAEITAAKIDGKINTILGRLDTNNKYGRELMLPLTIDPAYNHDKVVISFGRPQGEDAFDTLAFKSAPALSFQLNYRPTRFAHCNGSLSIRQCSGTFDDIPDILERRASGSTLDSVLKEDPNPDDPNSASLFKRLSEANALPTAAERKAAIAQVCDDFKNPQKFKAYGALNKLDRLLVRYAFLSVNSDYLRNADLASPNCFDEERREKRLLVDLGPDAQPDFRFPANHQYNVRQRVNEVSRMLRNLSAPNSKTALFGAAGVLDIRMNALIEGDGGAALRPEGAVGPEAGAALNDLIFTLGPQCFQVGSETQSGAPGDTAFGFLQRIKDRAPGARVIAATFAPIVISLDTAAPNGELRAKSLTIPGSLSEYGALLQSPGAEAVLRQCGAEFAQSADKAAFEAMLKLVDQ